MKKFKIGLQLYSVREQMNASVENTLRLVSEMGYDCVEFAGYFNESPQRLKELLEKYNLKCYSSHVGSQEYFKEPEKYIEYLKAIGAQYSVIPWNNKNILQTAEGFEEFKATCVKLANLLSKYDLKLLYHNHDFEFFNLDGELIFDRLYNEVSSDLLNPQIDTCWVKYAGYDPVEYIQKYSGRIKIVHLKDFYCDDFSGETVYDLIGDSKSNDKKNNGFDYRPLGMGVQDMPSIIDASEKAGAEILIVEQDDYTINNPIENARISREYLRELGY